MEKLACKVITSMEKIIGTKEPKGTGMLESISGLKGETISYQMAYCWEGPRTWAQVEIISPLKEQIKVRVVNLVPCEFPYFMEFDNDYLSTEPGLYPDLLTEIPGYGISLVHNQWKSLWIDISIDETVDAGQYPVEVIIKKEDTILGKTVVTCEVVDEVLPHLPIFHTEWFHCDCLANYYDVDVFSEAHWAIVENFVQLAVKRKCNMLLTPIFTPPLDTAVGGERRTVQLVDVTVEEDSYIFGFEKLERWVEMCNRCGIEYFEMSHLFTQWGAAMAPKIMGMENGKEVQLFGWETKATGPEYTNFLHQFIPSLIIELEKLGIQEKTYFHISDEPSQEQLESYKAAKLIVADLLKEYHIIDALSDYSFYEQGIVENPICGIDHMKPFLEHQVEPLWTYYCVGQNMDVSNRFIVQPGYRTRILGAMLYKYKIGGFLHWGFNFYNCQHSLYEINPYQVTDADGSLPAGDPFIIYPGKKGIPEDSIRSMLMDEAMSDLCAMKLLEDLAGRDVVMECLEYGEYEPVTLHTYPRSEKYMVTMREKINQAIKACL